MCIKVNIWAVIKLSVEIRVRQHRRDNRVWVTIPDLIGCPHPARRVIINVVRDPSYKTLPWDISMSGRVDGCIQILMILKRGELVHI